MEAELRNVQHRWQTVHGPSPYCSLPADNRLTKNSAATGVFVSEDASDTSSANTCSIGEGGHRTCTRASEHYMKLKTKFLF